uniref:Uncharacterized protein n=1 Tax=Anguilla anguilla TaxID=7936 RepID=A0A0E9UAU3_ANGAN
MTDWSFSNVALTSPCPLLWLGLPCRCPRAVVSSGFCTATLLYV